MNDLIESMTAYVMLRTKQNLAYTSMHTLRIKYKISDERIEEICDAMYKKVVDVGHDTMGKLTSQQAWSIAIIKIDKLARKLLEDNDKSH